MVGRFDAFGDDPQAEVVGEVDGGLDDGGVCGFGSEAGGEGAVDLDVGEGQVL